jgi:hypothetical protein
MTKPERRIAMREIVKECVKKTNTSGILTMRYSMKSGAGEIKCCERAFYMCYGITGHMMKTLRDVSI